MPMTSVCPGCVHEQAHGHADVTHCADRVPAAWCSCDMLRRAEAERDEAVFLRYCYEERKLLSDGRCPSWIAIATRR